MQETIKWQEHPFAIFRLADKQMENPHQVLTDFFSDTNLTETHRAFDKIIETRVEQ